MDNVTNERTFQSWDDFADLATRLDPGKDINFPGAFRGHAKARWRLEPTLLRRFLEAKVTEEEALDLEGVR